MMHSCCGMCGLQTWQACSAGTGGTDEAPAPDGGTGTPAAADAEEARVLADLSAHGRARYRNVSLRIELTLPQVVLSPAACQLMAEQTAQRYPNGVIVFNLKLKSCCWMMPGSQPRRLHALCGVELIRVSRLAVGLAIARDGTYAVRVGRRAAPLVRVLQGAS